MRVAQRWFSNHQQQSMSRISALSSEARVSTKTSGVKGVHKTIPFGEQVFIVGKSKVGGEDYIGRENE